MLRADAAPPVGGMPRTGWLERLRDWRHRTVAKPAFQRWAAAFPLTRPIARRQASELFDLVAGFVYSQVLLACVRLNLFDRLADGPLPLQTLAERTGMNAEGLERLVAAAVALDLLERRSADRVALGRLGAPMAGNRAIAAMIEHHTTLYADLADPLALLRRQGPGAMANYWPYVNRNAGTAPAALSEERVAEYSALMSASLPLVSGEVLALYPFKKHRVLLDVGGGEGTFVRAVAAQAPGLQLMLFDLPAVAERAKSSLTAAGLGPRVRTHGGDFFKDDLPTGADVISLIRVCFDHPDEHVLTLLRSIRRALPPDGTLVLAEPMAGERGAEAMGDAYFGLYLLAMGRGRPRSADRLNQMLVESGFTSVRRLPAHMPLHTGVLVARCADGKP